jgi:glutamine synthetase
MPCVVLSGTVNVASRASWGFEDRDACLRVPDSDAKNLRIEHRLAGADANPYLVLAAILVGLEQGLEGAREPIAPLNEDRSSGIDFPLEMLAAVQSMQRQPATARRIGRGVCGCLLRKQASGPSGIHARHQCA